MASTTHTTTTAGNELLQLESRSKGRPSGAKALAYYERDGHTCVWCGGEVVHVSEAYELAALLETKRARVTGSLDHRICYTHGGTWEPSNLLLACVSCNSRRSDTPEAEWISQLAREQVPFCGDKRDPQHKIDEAKRREIRNSYRAEIARRTGRSYRNALLAVARSPRYSEEARNAALRALRALSHT